MNLVNGRDEIKIHIPIFNSLLPSAFLGGREESEEFPFRHTEF